MRGTLTAFARLVGGALLLAACSPDPLQGADFPSIAAGRSNPQILYTAANPSLMSFRSDFGNVGIYRSEDGGSSWNRTAGSWWDAVPSPPSSGATVTWVEASPFDAERVLVSTEKGIFRSTDGGAKWTATGYDLKNGVAPQLSFHPTRAGWVYALKGGPLVISTDDGESWQLPPAPTPPAVLPSGCANLAFDAAEPNRLYASCGVVLVSNDAGFSWQPAAGLDVKSTPVLIASPTEGGHLWAAANNGVWESIDAGTSFHQITDFAGVNMWPDVVAGTDVGVTAGAFVPSVDSPVLAFASSGAGVVGVRINDGSVIDMGAALARRADSVTDLKVSPSGAIRIATAANCRGVSGIYETHDLGHTWKTLLAATPNPRPRYTYDGTDPHAHFADVTFFRDVSPARQKQILADHKVIGEFCFFNWCPLRTSPNDRRSADDLISEFAAIDEVDCIFDGLP